MNILTANTVTTVEFSSKLEEINVKYKKEKEDLKKIIAETARSQAEQILADDNDDSMGNPEELCKKLAELRLQYNSIIVKQKEEFNSTMKEYTDKIMTNMGKWQLIKTRPNSNITSDDIPLCFICHKAPSICSGGSACRVFQESEKKDKALQDLAIKILNSYEDDKRTAIRMIFSKVRIKKPDREEQRHNQIMQCLENTCKTYHIVRRTPLRDEKALVMKMYDCIKYKMVY